MPLKSWADLLQDAGDSGGSFDPLPPGDYDFVIDSAEAKQAQSGKMMYVVKAKVESGPEKGRILFHQFVVSPENSVALSIFFRHMSVLGLKREFFTQSNPSDHQVAEALVGRRFRGQVAIRQWQGQDRNEIKQFYTAPTGGTPTPGGPSIMPTPAPAFAAPAAPAPAPAPITAPAPAPAPPIQQTQAPAPVADAAPPAAPDLPAPPAPAVSAEQPAAPPAPAASGAFAPPPPPPF